MAAHYAFSGTWVLPASHSRVHEVLVDLEHYPDWWPQVCAVASLGPDDARVLCRSVLPYTLDLVLHAVSRSTDRLEVAVAGDLAGTVRFDLTPVAGGTRLDLTQSVHVGGLLGLVSAVLSPLLRWNHHRMMAGCVAGLSAAARGGLEAQAPGRLRSSTTGVVGG